MLNTRLLPALLSLFIIFAFLSPDLALALGGSECPRWTAVAKAESEKALEAELAARTAATLAAPAAKRGDVGANTSLAATANAKALEAEEAARKSEDAASRSCGGGDEAAKAARAAAVEARKAANVSNELLRASKSVNDADNKKTPLNRDQTILQCADVSTMTVNPACRDGHVTAEGSINHYDTVDNVGRDTLIRDIGEQVTRTAKDTTLPGIEGTPVPAKDIQDAMTKAYQKMADTAKQAGVLNVGGNPATPNTPATTPTYTPPSENLLNAYKQYADSMTAAGQQGSNLSGMKSNDYYTYNPTTGNFVGNVNKAEIAPVNIPNGEKIAGLANTSNTNAVLVTYDAKTDKVAVANTYTGYRGEFNSRSTEEITQDIANYKQNPASVQKSSQLDYAALYEDKIAANQKILPVGSSNPQRDAELIAGIAIAEANSLGQKGVDLAAEVIATRAIKDGKSVMDVLAAPGQFQPVTERARLICGCKSPSQSHREQAVNAIANEAKSRTGYSSTLDTSQKIMNGSHVYSGVTRKDNELFTHFSNVPLTRQYFEQGKSTQATWKWVSSVANDPNSITVVRPGSRGVQHTYGIAPGTKTVSVTAGHLNSFDMDTLTANPSVSTYTAPPGTPGAVPTTPGTTPPGTPGAPATPPASTPFNIPNIPGLPNLNGGVGGNLKTLVDGAMKLTGIDKNSPAGQMITGVSNIAGGLLNSLSSRNSDGSGSTDRNTDTNNPGPSNDYYSPNPDDACPPYPLSCNVARSSGSYVPVILSIDDSAGTVSINRPDITRTLENPSAYYDDQQYQALLKLLNETPILFNNESHVVYSNGLYSPPVENGTPITDSSMPEYVYTVEYIDQDGKPIDLSGSDQIMNEGFIKKTIRRVFGNASQFNNSEVRSITYRVVDPDSNVPADEYYDYEITLNDGSKRSITVPVFASVSTMVERFNLIGFRGNILTLVQSATERQGGETSGIIGKMVSAVTKFVQNLRGSEEEERTTELPLPSTAVTTDAIERVFVYPSVDVLCPDIDGYSKGFMYMAILKDLSDTSRTIAITDSKCGSGTLEEMTIATLYDLETSYGIEGAVSEETMAKVHIYTSPVPYSSSNVQAARMMPESTPAEQPGETPSVPTTPAPAVTIPNLTNTITFEAKTVRQDGSIERDWSTASSLTISPGTQLYFRWDASDYQQCLLFLQDGGNYTVNRSGGRTTGNTETENYSITERTGTYSIECGGQRNGEFGVDTRAIQVTVQ